MGYFIAYDAANNTLRTSFEGSVTDDNLGGAYKAVRSFSVPRPPCKGLIDFSGATSFEVSNDAVRRFARTPPAVQGDLMQLIVAPKDLSYGLARMFTILSAETRPNMHVVRTMEEAYSLLGITWPQFSPISDLNSAVA